ncbi:TIGR02594 family protein [Aquimarina sp. BL5]|uniref:TIGR02594 family protein n=1 Tax=Aquimarina sp. BL5 TaxID=1714860 RepID=UPI000E470636|nr:TIGR02594 family protein [Aquimarina sp. BL5]AXT52653.1 TIGR02594 family protein [Aquimarina sp. BL5]RKN11717.1 TIGR02594 family protein [Aquimarina sp. BL5]
MNILEMALSQYGVTEINGSKDHPQIVSYFSELGFDGVKLKDETAWCSAFANWVAKKTGYSYSGKLNARSWLNVGKSTNTPSVGDVVVLWRESPNSWKGHVGFFIKETRGFVYVLGGNQNNKVCISAYPKNRVLEYKKLTRHG